MRRKRFKQKFTKEEFYAQLEGFCVKHNYVFDKIADEIICPSGNRGCLLCEMDKNNCVDYAKAFVITKIRQKKLEKLLS